MKNLSWGLLSLLTVITLAFNGPVAKATTEHHGHHHVTAKIVHHADAGDAQVKDSVKDTCCEDCGCSDGGECACEDCGCCKDGTCCTDCCAGGQCSCDDCGCCKDGTCADGSCNGGCEDGSCSDGCCGGDNR